MNMELTSEQIARVNAGTMSRTDKLFYDLMIKLYKLRGTKMEEVYQIPKLSDEEREYIRSRWYKI